MTSIDLNMLVVLDVLLTEQSVVRAAQRLELSPSAMSRALARLRVVTGDQLLVRAGHNLVPTPLAVELRAKVSAVVADAQNVLRPSIRLDLASLERTFTIRANDGFIERYGARIAALVEEQAPLVRLRFAAKPDKSGTMLRDGIADLEVGVVSNMAPELRIQALFRDKFVGVVRTGHPLADSEDVTAQRYTAYRHVSVSRRGHAFGPIDDALRELGAKRIVSVIVPSFPDALALARTSDLVASVPERQTEAAREGMHTFRLPVVTPDVTVSQIWHPRLDADCAHRWLRTCLRKVCSDAPETWVVQ
ncbi:LysR family transcriptional regulator [Trinickia soli]|uniref:LysR family transcriptional regulator n=1 Tax=Trinickia soli TaxID=380675 RepID=A0A2N7W9S9_9BURK|nr:LysR family transcriptional regulator [Trinickia soli]PMS26139.1 LysR family transcriptional regulator [Trinickia soli]CAB3679931.1 PCP degradation transcriptional activation protein [Trinickia soli]